MDEENGSIVFAFRSVQMPDGTTRDIHSTVGGIQAESWEGLDVGKEGEIKATTSTFARFWLPFHLSAIESSWRLDFGENRMVSVRRGRKGFGLLGPAQRRHLWARQSGLDTLAPQRDFAMLSSLRFKRRTPAHTPIFLRLDSTIPR